MPIIYKPSGDTDLSNAVEVPEGTLPQNISGLAAGDYIVGRVSYSSAVTVTATSAYTATLNEFSRDRTIFDSGAHLDTDPAAASVFISGGSDAPDGSIIEWRAVDVETSGAETTAWADAVTLSTGDGSWGAFVSLPRTAAWMRIETRVKGSTAAAVQMTNRCAAGHVWAIWEQSNWARMATNNSALTSLIPTVDRPDDVQIVTRAGAADEEGDSESAGTLTAELTSINDTTPGSPSFASIANALSAARPGEKFCIGWHCKGGTSVTAALTTVAEDATYNSGTDRDWSGEFAVWQEQTADGSQVGAIWIAGWIADHFGAPGTHVHSERIMPTFLARGNDGSAIDARTPGVFRTEGLPRMFCAIAQDGRDFGVYDPTTNPSGGIYDMTYSKIGWLGPHGKARTSMPGADSITAFGDYDGYAQGDDTQYQSLVEDVDRWHNGAEALPEALPWLGLTHGAERKQGDEAHMHGSTTDGRQRLARVGMFYALRQLGLTNTDLPRLDLRHDATDGSAAYFGITGRNVTTERLARWTGAGSLDGISGSNVPQNIPDLNTVGSTIAAADDHRTEVMGFSINNVAATNVDIYTVLAGDTELLAAGFTAGQTVARVQPGSGTLAATDKIVYGVDRLPGYQAGGDDGDYSDSVRAWMNWLVVDMGQVDLPRLPVQHQSILFDLATTLPVPASFVIDGTTSWQTAGGVAELDNLMAFEVKGTLSATATDTMIQLGSSSAAKISLKGTGAIEVRDTGTTLTLNTPTQAAGVPFHVRATFDRATGTITAQDVLNDYTLSEALGPGTSTGTGTFPSSAINIATGGLEGDFEFFRVHIGTASPDWDSDTPTFAVEGIASAPYYVETGTLTMTGPAPTQGGS